MTLDPQTLHPQVRARLVRLRFTALAIGCIAAGASAAGAYFQPAQFFPAWLIACLFWWGISLGSLAIAMIYHLSGGAWGLAIRRVLEAAYIQFPLVAILFSPLLLGLPTLYIWARPESSGAAPPLHDQTWYLNVRDFELRAAAYFVLWTLLAVALNRLSGGEPGHERRRRWLAMISGPGLVIWGLTVTFAAVDWGMSLEPHWFSTSYGVLLGSGQGIAALALAIVVVVWLGDLPPWSGLATPECLNDLGNFLFAFIMFWAYIAFTQYLIIWSGNLPEEISWFVHRSTGPWQVVAALLAALHFAVPFLLLLGRQIKRQPRRLLAVAILLLAMRVVDLHWLVMPAFDKQLAAHWLNVAALLATGGFWLAAFAWRLDARAALPVDGLSLESQSLNEHARHAAS